ncbi:MAG: trypsin-like serine protease [Chloroflexus sp.]|uniref:trypsin-like serine protease n=1 Tax=Chloroflexus sp. TaxID=1904827 RepID=UPI0030A2CA5B
MRTFTWQSSLAALLLVICLIPSSVLSRPGPPPTPSIVGGEPVQPGDYPWLVALLFATITDEAAAFCGGALIDDGGDFTTTQWVLTAAHCLVFGDEVMAPTEIDVLIGQQQLSATTAAQRKSVARIITYPLYISGAVLANDIALLQLTEPVTGITPIRIATPADAARYAAGTTAQIAGWGNRSPQVGFDPPDIAHKASVPIVDIATCNARYGGGLNDALHLCAGQYPAGGIDTCQGDSGGPLMVPDGSGGLLHAGIVSFGQGCAWPNFPGVYAKTAFFADWITAHITNQPHIDVWQLQFSDGLEEYWFISTAAPNDPITYTVFVANSGPTDLTDVNLSVTLPAGATLIAGSISDSGVYNSSTGEITWSVGDLSSGEVVIRTYQVQATANVTFDTYQVTANSGTVVRNNTRGQLITLVDQAYPFLSSSAPEFVETGTVFPLTFAVANFGLGTGADLSDLELVVDLPSGVEVVEIGDGGVQSGNQVRWSIGDLPATGIVEITIFLRAGAVGDFVRITDVELLSGTTRLAYGLPTQAVFIPAVRYLPVIQR